MVFVSHCVLCVNIVYIAVIRKQGMSGGWWEKSETVSVPSHLLVMSSLLDQSLSSSEFQLTCLQNYQNFHPALIVSTPPLVKKAFTWCSLKSSQLNRTEQDTKKNLPSPSLLNVCLLLSTISSASRKGFCNGGNTSTNKSCLPKLYLERGCREKEHVGKMETKREREKKEAVRAILLVGKRNMWFKMDTNRVDMVMPLCTLHIFPAISRVQSDSKMYLHTLILWHT